MKETKMDQKTVDQKTEDQPKARGRSDAEDRRATLQRPVEREAKDDTAPRPAALHDWASI
jgi:hypothetical protein